MRYKNNITDTNQLLFVEVHAFGVNSLIQNGPKLALRLPELFTLQPQDYRKHLKRPESIQRDVHQFGADYIEVKCDDIDKIAFRATAILSFCHRRYSLWNLLLVVNAADEAI